MGPADTEMTFNEAFSVELSHLAQLHRVTHLCSIYMYSEKDSFAIIRVFFFILHPGSITKRSHNVCSGGFWRIDVKGQR